MTDWRGQPKVTVDDLAADLQRLGLEPGARVLVHSSLSRLGHVEGGAEAVIEALLQATGPEGTVLFPTLTGTAQDGPEHPPRIDVRLTPCWTGRIPETARRQPDAYRSLHPTHSVAALGADAERWSSGHEVSRTPCDRASPYYRLIDEAGCILLLGAGQDSNTTLHCLEELADVPYHLQPDVTECVVVDARGKEVVVRNRLHLWRWQRDFARIDVPLREAGAMQIGRVGQAEARLIRAEALATVILPLIEDDPLYLLARHARQAYRAAEP